jgi:hypothetical protein
MIQFRKIDNICKEFRRSKRTIYRWIQDGDLKNTRTIHDIHLIDIIELKNFLKKRKKQFDLYRKKPFQPSRPEGDRRTDPAGYVWIYIKNQKGKISARKEHRVIMEEILGRPLHRWEHIHHKNGLKNDNRPENLEIVINTKHHGYIMCPYCQKQFKIH